MRTKEKTVVTVKSPQRIETRQQLPYFVGISKQTAGANHISMNLVVIPPGAIAQAHYHKGFETGIYVLEGQVETKYGEGINPHFSPGGRALA